MKKTILYAIFIGLLIIGCNTKTNPKSFSITGSITGEIPAFFYFKYGTKNDSVLVTNGQFHIVGKVENPMSSYIAIPNISVMVDDYFYLENENIRLEISVEKKVMNSMDINFIKVDSISGSKTELMRREFQLYEEVNSNSSDWNTKLYKELYKIISENPKNGFSSDVLISQIKKESLTQIQITNLYQKINTTVLSERRLAEFDRALHPEDILTEEKQLYDFSLPNPNNDLTSTKDFRGKIVLIEFWASWCAPCRKTNPELLKVYDEFKNSGFEVLGVSLDTNIDKWKRAIKKDQLIWKNVIDIQAFEGKIASKYNITGIPSNFLIDTNGKILSRNISMKDLRTFLKVN